MLQTLTSHTVLQEHADDFLAFLLQKDVGQAFHKRLVILGTLILRPIKTT